MFNRDSNTLVRSTCGIKVDKVNLAGGLHTGYVNSVYNVYIINLYNHI